MPSSLGLGKADAGKSPTTTATASGGSLDDLPTIRH
jgi:hypothetical protein